MANDQMTAELESKALATVKTGTAVATNGHSDPYAAYADAVAPQFIIGVMLRFSKGDWLVGDDAAETEAPYTANLDELMAGWIKWWDSKPIEHIMVRVGDGIPPKLRGDLGDHDQAKWEVDKDGNPKDPWQFTNYLPLLSEKGELFTFTTSSRGGINAVAALARRYATHRKRHPDVFPVIKLSVDSYQHKEREYGRIKFPVFEPAGYVPKTDFLAALAGAGFAAADVPPEDADPNDDISDIIPE